MEATSENRSPGRLFSWIERVGNKVPNPFLLFVYLIVVLMVATAIISALDLAVKNPSNGEIVRVNNLLSVAGIQWILPNIIKNFSSFTPLGSILALVIGAGLAEKVGLLQSLMVKMASRVSRRYASYMVLFIALMALLVVPENAPLRNPATGAIIPSPFIQGIVPIIILFFFVVAIAYGVVTRQIRRPDDIPQLLVDPMKGMAGFIVMVFPLSQFVAFFNWSNMGKFMAIGLTDVLESAGVSGAPAFLGLMFLSAFLCMFIASGSAIWSILAPVFVPMFMLLGFHPAFAQMIFRIADSAVLPLAPMSPFLPLFLAFLQRYQKDAQLGTYYVLIFPYPLVFFISWIALLLVWYLLGLPIGPGVWPKLP
ncbi:AbgT family transporter [Pantoea agglomerans]|uniref:AbgT family transporter n=1 Tax=Enterobacter agglomerans TaxID=549 RepID=UPI0023B0B586|nr:AbgT family transporter [Pantoea agglomerans]WEC72282.1 AbgT family transporter [Pantoea agglomerans]